MPTPPKRWTVLIISHDTDAHRSISVSVRAVRLLVSVGLVVGLVALIGVGSLIAGFGRIEDRRVRVTTASPGTVASHEVLSLRQQAAELNGLLDSIRQEDSRLRASAGIPSLDTTTLLRRFLPRLPSVRRDRRAQEHVEQSVPRIPGDSTAARRAAAIASASAESLLSQAGAVAERMRTISAGSQLRRDTIAVLSLHPDSLRDLLSAGRQQSTRRGVAVEFFVGATTALAAPSESKVSALSQTAPGLWDLEMTDRKGVATYLVAEGRPLVRVGEKVSEDQLVFVVDASRVGMLSPRPPVHVERRTAGSSLDPTSSQQRRVRAGPGDAPTRVPR